jgi:hypothetical protein
LYIKYVIAGRIVKNVYFSNTPTQTPEAESQEKGLDRSTSKNVLKLNITVVTVFMKSATRGLLDRIDIAYDLGLITMN